MSDPLEATLPSPESAPPLTNPNLSATLRADYEAIRNDLQQANELAADFQRQLAGKSNDFAEMKRLFEKTQADLVHLQAGIAELRKERHRLANEAMRAVAYELKLKDMAADRTRLQCELESARHTLETEMQSAARHARERTAHIAELTFELETLKQQVAHGNRVNTPGIGLARVEPEVKAALAELTHSVARLSGLLHGKAIGSSDGRVMDGGSARRSTAAAEECIDIVFEA